MVGACTNVCTYVYESINASCYVCTQGTFFILVLAGIKGDFGANAQTRSIVFSGGSVVVVMVVIVVFWFG
ncbi:hypothetical protein F4775DRAFT_562697 [Biscogniauxia sp. FL1348]|nr:hypothetical protein F4775DRAFT_562697 [Biscogniauxia sp. FL1348]